MNISHMLRPVFDLTTEDTIHPIYPIYPALHRNPKIVMAPTFWRHRRLSKRQTPLHAAIDKKIASRQLSDFSVTGQLWGVCCGVLRQKRTEISIVHWIIRNSLGGCRWAASVRPGTVHPAKRDKVRCQAAATTCNQSGTSPLRHSLHTN